MTIPRRRRRRRAGFTLIEVLLVLVILMILAGMAAIAYRPIQENAKVKAAHAQIGLFKTPLRAYDLDVGDFPSTQQGLAALREAPSDLADVNKWKGKYLEDPVPPDPWGNEYQYEYPGTHEEDTPDIWSFGPDGLNGTEDDIGNWSLNE
jgi:general secretion pathway protein G